MQRLGQHKTQTVGRIQARAGTAQTQSPASLSICFGYRVLHNCLHLEDPALSGERVSGSAWIRPGHELCTLPEALRWGLFLLPSFSEGHLLYQSAQPRSGPEMIKLFCVAPNMKISKTFMANLYLGSGNLNSGPPADPATFLSPAFLLF